MKYRVYGLRSRLTLSAGGHGAGIRRQGASEGAGVGCGSTVKGKGQEWDVAVQSRCKGGMWQYSQGARGRSGMWQYSHGKGAGVGCGSTVKGKGTGGPAQLWCELIKRLCPVLNLINCQFAKLIQIR